MSQFEKMKAKIMRDDSPRDITPAELQNFMIKYGFELTSKRGSHFSFKHSCLRHIVTIPMHSPIKRPYIKLVKEMIEEVEQNETLQN